MKNFLTSFIFSLSFLSVSAQQDRFIYLQTENKQPFFVKLNNNILNSYPLGYLIIPKLDDGLYSLVIGFPETDYEQEFNCSINKKDVGFLIKNVGERQWQLLNVQTNNIIVPGGIITKPVIAYEKETDPFSTMLANAVHDSTILRKDVAKVIFPEKPNEQIIKDTANTIVSNNDAAITKQDHILADSTNKGVTTAILPVPTTDSTKDLAKEIVPEKSTGLVQKDSITAVITKPGDLKTDSSVNDVVKITSEKPAEIKDTTQAVVKDVAVTKTKNKRSKKADKVVNDSTLQEKETVKVIPEKIIGNKDTAQSTTLSNDFALLRSVIKRRSRKTNKDGIELMYTDDNGDTKDTIRILIPSEKKAKKDLEINTEPVVITTPAQQENKKEDEPKKKTDKLSEEEKKIIQEAKEPAVKSTMINSDCKNSATEEDFLKTRKKMVAENNDEDMIKAAKKIFKTKCFTTEQIKNLSVLFLKDEGKYMFFDAAYPFASDSDLYPSLENQLTDNYYITRFRAMIHK